MAKLTDLTESTESTKNDILYLSNEAGSSDGKQAFNSVFALPQLTSEVINLNNFMTASEIQDIINDVPRYIPRGSNVAFQFADGIYNLDAKLDFTRFYGEGLITIQGNTLETDATVLHTTQQVHLNFNNGTNGLYIVRNSNFVDVKNPK